MTEYKNENVIERSDWTGDLNDILKVGCLVDGEIVWELIECVPPRSMSPMCMQCGEPHSTRLDEETGKYRQTYSTFKKEPGTENLYRYCGHCFGGENVERGKAIQYA